MADENGNNEVGVDSTVEVEVIPPSDEQNEGGTTDSSNNE